MYIDKNPTLDEANSTITTITNIDSTELTHIFINGMLALDDSDFTDITNNVITLASDVSLEIDWNYDDIMVVYTELI